MVALQVGTGLAKADRVGIMGWSYGGYLSAMCLARAPETFRCAVAGAPVTSWDGYDTHYTERYMGGTPQSAPEAYAASSVMSHLDTLQVRSARSSNLLSPPIPPPSPPVPLACPIARRDSTRGLLSGRCRGH